MMWKSSWMMYLLGLHVPSKVDRLGLANLTREYQALARRIRLGREVGVPDGARNLVWHRTLLQLLLNSREELSFISREAGLGPNPSASLSSKVRIIIVLTGNSVSQEYSEDYVASALCCETLSAKYDYTGISIQRSQSTFQTLIIEAL